MLRRRFDDREVAYQGPPPNYANVPEIRPRRVGGRPDPFSRAIEPSHARRDERMSLMLPQPRPRRRGQQHESREVVEVPELSTLSLRDDRDSQVSYEIVTPRAHRREPESHTSRRTEYKHKHQPPAVIRVDVSPEPPPVRLSLARERRHRSPDDNHRRPLRRHQHVSASVLSPLSSSSSSSESDSEAEYRGRRDTQRRSSPPQRLRSCIRGSRQESSGRARARSAHFREDEASKHDVGTGYHSQPGAEAREAGRYLRRLEDYDLDDLASETYEMRYQPRR